MDINFRGKGWPSIYFDPEFEEMIELTKYFDTLRIGGLEEKDGWHLVIASGLGNTHSTLSRAIGEMNPRCKPNREGLKYGGLDLTSILYEEDGKFWFNQCDLSGYEKTSIEEGLKDFPEPIRTMLKEIVKLAEERLNKI